MREQQVELFEEQATKVWERAHSRYRFPTATHRKRVISRAGNSLPEAHIDERLGLKPEQF
jgi:hypothetical protein